MKKLITYVLSLVLAAQLAVPMSAMAEGETTLPERHLIDFSTNVSFGNSNSTTAGGAFSYVKGQYAKGKDDKSFRMYTLGTETGSEDLFVYKAFDEIAKEETDKYAHVSLEFLNEEALSGALVQLQYINSNDTKTYYPLVNFAASNPLAVSLANGLKSQNQKIGSWNKADFYFEYGTGNVTIMMNGTVAGTFTLKDSATIKSLVALRITHNRSKTDDAVNPSAIQFDNILFENTDTIPTTHDYRYLGEIIDFDDGISKTLNTTEGSWQNKYYIRTANGALCRYNWTGNPAFRFWVPSVHTFETGVAGNPAWNQSVHSVLTGNDQEVQYNTGVKDLKAGEYGHLTFKIRNIAPTTHSTGLRAKTSTVKFNDETTNSAVVQLFEMPNGNAEMKFFGTATNQKWANGTWYKIDMVFKNGNGTDTYTKVDCYINGVKKLSDYEWKAADGNYSALKYVGDLYFNTGANRNYYIDDIGFGVFSADTLHDPTVGYSLSSSDDLLSACIDNTNKIIILPDTYTVADFKAKVNEKDYVTVYNSNGSIVVNGTMAGCSVKVSNGFGGGVWYSIADSKVVVEDTFETGDTQNFGTTAGDKTTYSTTTKTELGGKTDTDTAFILESNSGIAMSAAGRIDLANQNWKSSKVVFEGSFMPISGAMDVCLVPNGYSPSDAQYIVRFKENGTIGIMYDHSVLEEKWQPNRWYKVAAVMEYGSKTMKVYLNGDLVWDGDYTVIASDAAKADFGANGSGFKYLSRVRIPVYGTNVNGKYAFDNLRVSYGDYDASKDKIEISSSDVVVNNRKGIIGFDDGFDSFSADELVSYFEDEEMSVYADNTFTTEAGDLTANSVAVVTKGEAFKYYEMGYKTKQLLKPEIAYAENSLTATAVLEDTALKVEDSTAVLLLAVYGENGLETVVSVPAASVKDLAADLTTSIPSVDMLNKTAKAFLWDTTSTMIPLYNSTEFAGETSEN